MEELITACLVHARVSSQNPLVRDEMEALINASIFDMRGRGVVKIYDEYDDITDPLVIECIKLYTKSRFNSASKDSERLFKSYEMLRDSMALRSEYNEID